MRTDDGSIVRECLDGKPGAFGILVDKYKAGIYAFVYTELRNFHDAQDVTQEVFLQAYRGLRSLRRWESFSFWLYRIARNLCKKWIRTQSRRPDSEFIEDQDPGMLEVPSLDSRRESQMSESLQEALDSLPDAYRQVLMLHYFGGMTIKNIARATGTSPGAIGMRLSRARAQLRAEMIDMMDTAFEGQRLQASFTFRVVEAVKRIKINPMPRTEALPWGLSLAAGTIIAVMSLGSHFGISSPTFSPASLRLPSGARVLKTGEIPVDILRIPRIPVIVSEQAYGTHVLQAPEKAQIVFSSERDGDHEIYVMDTDGSNQRRLTNDPADNMYPVWSPDGKRIAFMSNGDAADWREWENGWRKWEIYLMDADGKNRINLTNHPADDSAPDWSPDGRRIAFHSGRDGNYEIYVMDADGSNLRNLTAHAADDQEPDWSPDGQSITFQSDRDGNYEVYVMDIDGENLSRLLRVRGTGDNGFVTDNFSPASPRSRRPDIRRLTDRPALDILPVWSPDGQRIGFVSKRDGNYEIYTMNADGKNQTNLTNHPAWDWKPGWSPDGRSITFVSLRAGEWDVFVMDADGQNVRNLTNDSATDERSDWFDPAFAPRPVSPQHKLPARQDEVSIRRRGGRRTP